MAPSPRSHSEPPSVRNRLFALLELFLSEGSGLLQSLEHCAREIGPGAVATATLRAIEGMRVGASLAEGWSESPSVFSETELTAIREGEATGTLESVFCRLAENPSFSTDGDPASAQFLAFFAASIGEYGRIADVLQHLQWSSVDERFGEFALQLQRSGGSIGQAMEACPALFPISVAHLVHSAEAHGDLQRTLGRCADAMRRGLIE